jgi:predicted acyltransferase
MSTTSSRADALDALRGLAIIGMILSGQLPFHEFVLPDWMYHAQVPPPDHKFIPTLPGITWVDLVFPFFLFAMGAAFPLALSKKISAGVSKWKISFSILERGVLLGFFALYVQAIRPYVMSTNPDTMTWLVSIAAFLFLFPMYARLPETWNKFLRWGVKSAGWICAILFFVLTTYPDGSGFKLTRSDIIIVVLTNMAVFGAFTWIITRDNLLLRLGLLGVLMAIRMSNMPAGIEGWVNDIWRWSPIPWMYTLYYQQYLFIVIPGTILGDMIFRFMRMNNQLRITNDQLPTPDVQWPSLRYIFIVLLMLLFNIELLVGFFSRSLVETTLLTFVLCGAGYWMMNKPMNDREKLYRELFHWAIFWLVLGLFFEPYEGGIKKDKATVSYYFITSGLAICTYIFFSVVIDVFKKKHYVQLLIDNGQNPMIAYAGINNFVIPLLGVTGILSVMNSLVTTPFLGFLKGLIVTLLLMLVTSFCTKKKIFWRT